MLEWQSMKEGEPPVNEEVIVHAFLAKAHRTILTAFLRKLENGVSFWIVKDIDGEEDSFSRECVTHWSPFDENLPNFEE